jgi:hypothetical protein
LDWLEVWFGVRKCSTLDGFACPLGSRVDIAVFGGIVYANEVILDGLFILRSAVGFTPRPRSPLVNILTSGRFIVIAPAGGSRVYEIPSLIYGTIMSSSCISKGNHHFHIFGESVECFGEEPTLRIFPQIVYQVKPP